MNYDFLFELFGLIGAGILSITFLPQVYKTIKSGKTDDISMSTILLNIIASFFFVPYSFHFLLLPLIISNTTILLCQIVIFCYCVKNECLKSNTIDIESDI